MPEKRERSLRPWRPKGAPYWVLSKRVIAHGYAGTHTALVDAKAEMQRDPFIEAPRIESKLRYIANATEELLRAAVEAQGIAYKYRQRAPDLEDAPEDAKWLAQLAQGGLTALAASLRLSPRAKALRRANDYEELAIEISGLIAETQAGVPSLVAYLRHHQRAKQAERLLQRLAALQGRFRAALPPGRGPV